MSDIEGDGNAFVCSCYCFRSICVRSVVCVALLLVLFVMINSPLFRAELL